MSFEVLVKTVSYPHEHKSLDALSIVLKKMRKSFRLPFVRWLWRGGEPIRRSMYFSVSETFKSYVFMCLIASRRVFWSFSLSSARACRSVSLELMISALSGGVSFKMRNLLAI